MAYNFKTNLVYSFDIYPSNLLDTDFNNVTVLGVVGYDIAVMYNDIMPLHVMVYPTLPPGTPDNPQDYEYLLLRTALGQKTIIGLPWIKEDTITLVEHRKIRVLIDNVSVSDIPLVREALTQNGFNLLTITISD